MKKAERYEGQEILDMLENWDPNDPDCGDELTRGRVRTIYVRTKMGGKPVREIAEYYNLPINVIQGIRDGNIFPEITGAHR